PDVVFVSRAVRTQQTWQLVSKPGGVSAHEVDYVDDLYESTVSTVTSLVRGVDDYAHTVMVVGHEPTMAAAAEFLAGQGSDAAAFSQVRIGIPTGSYIVLESDAAWADWNRRTARLLSVQRPGDTMPKAMG
ncbi:MAG: histidine phosphatase family protein, partial [Cellulomonadaceae bacterium]|nr:histidine phosphatase family protein [Cellulomonadaceae bacterium]